MIVLAPANAIFFCGPFTGVSLGHCRRSWAGKSVMRTTQPIRTPWPENFSREPVAEVLVDFKGKQDTP